MILFEEVPLLCEKLDLTVQLAVRGVLKGLRVRLETGCGCPATSEEGGEWLGVYRITVSIFIS
jgi:hypothetical protein